MAGQNGKWKDTPMSLKIKKKMLSKGMSMTELARIIGIDKSSLAITIYGKRKGETYNKYLSMVLDVLDIKERKNKIA